MGRLTAFTKYALVGGVGTLTHYVCLLLLVEGVKVDPTLAAAAGAAAGALVNYSLNYAYTFRSRQRHTLALPRFLFVAVSGIMLSAGMVSVATAYGTSYLAGQVAATIAVLFLGFVLNRKWTFGSG
jgi:putative flippase GtrA